jgi:putative phage-type endonuclease
VNYHNINQNTSEWLELRRGKFTASMFKDLFMKESTAGYRNTLYKVVFERLTNEVPDSVTSNWMERGHELEIIARQVYELETFNKVRNGGFWEYSEWVGCSPDGLIGDNGLVEIKCPKYSTIIEYMLSGKLPTIYEWQVHGQMFVTGRKWCDFMAYHPNLKPLIIRIIRDEEKIKQLKDKLEESILKVKNKIKKLEVK